MFQKKLITANEKTLSISGWATELGITRQQVRLRLNRHAKENALSHEFKHADRTHKNPHKERKDRKDLTGKEFGDLIITGFSHKVTLDSSLGSNRYRNFWKVK